MLGGEGANQGASVRLGLVERQVRITEHLLLVVVGATPYGDADAGADID